MDEPTLRDRGQSQWVWLERGHKEGEAAELCWYELANDVVCQVRSHGHCILQVGVEDGVGQGRGTMCLKFGEEKIPTYLFTLPLGSVDKDSLVLNSKTRVTVGGRMEVEAAGATIPVVVYRGGNGE